MLLRVYLDFKNVGGRRVLSLHMRCTVCSDLVFAPRLWCVYAKTERRMGHLCGVRFRLLVW